MAQQPAKRWLIAGLGNPGPAYARTRHNAGAWFIKALCAQHSIRLQEHATFKASISPSCALAQQSCLCLIPNLFMNQSGQSIQAVAHYYRIEADRILIAHDELDLPLGTHRFKSGGGHAGHNGLRDIIQHLQTADFHRLRLGIAHPGPGANVSDYVLSVPPAAEDTLIQNSIQAALRALGPWLETQAGPQQQKEDAHGF